MKSMSAPKAYINCSRRTKREGQLKIERYVQEETKQMEIESNGCYCSHLAWWNLQHSPVLLPPNSEKFCSGSVYSIQELVQIPSHFHAHIHAYANLVGQNHSWLLISQVLASR